jgi:hypothetical protein
VRCACVWCWRVYVHEQMLQLYLGVKKKGIEFKMISFPSTQLYPKLANSWATVLHSLPWNWNTLKLNEISRD